MTRKMKLEDRAPERLYYTQSDFEVLWQAGAFRQVWLEATDASFAIRASTQTDAIAELVSVKRGRPRRFLNPAAGLAALRRMGVMRVEVRMEGWDLEMAALSMRMRPDVTARRLRDKRAREAAYHPNRAPEPEVVDRKDQLYKLMDTKMEEVVRRNSVTNEMDKLKPWMKDGRGR
ncbi:hypothetical protein ACFPT7_14185 [Acidicapsa dinghuensis]|uniref:Uncharacterized protein n=1 Tax=Acidicapsa dinghuensis TaxID=2218256 RepID=A0ABW1EH18_9BACT|nr:hypothetical protein [Acidicapsa dinghuensis]